MKFTIKLILLLMLNTNLSGQIGRLSLSPRQTTIQHIGLTKIEIDYSRPSMRGRTIFGELLKYNDYWRTGANQNTTISVDQDIYIDGKEIKKGKFSIITKPRKDEWDVFFYTEINNWDVPDVIDPLKVIAKITVPTVETSTTKDVLSIQIGDFTNYTFDLNISWENTMVTIPIGLNTKKLMDKKINDHLGGPQYAEYYLAAVYQMESGKEYHKGLKWINQAIDISEEKGWWNFRVRAILLLNLNRYKEAKDAADEGLELAEIDKRPSMVKEFNRILNEIDQANRQ